MSVLFLVVFTGLCLIFCTAVIQIQCPLDCVCHDTVWRCSSRRVTSWPLDNQPRIIIRGVTVLDMSRSNIDVLPNWPPTHNFPDLKMVLLADTVFDDGPRCRELECLQKLNLRVLSSCPANLRQGCAHVPCCYWSAVTTTRLPSSTIPFITNSSTSPPTARPQLSTTMDPRNGVTEQTHGSRTTEETIISLISTSVYNTTTYRQDDECVSDGQFIEVTTEYSAGVSATSVVPESVYLSEYLEVTSQDVVPTEDEARNVQSYSAVHQFTKGITGHSVSSSTVSVLIGEESLSEYQAVTTEDDLTTGHDEHVLYLQPTVSYPRVTNRVEYVGILERVLKPLQRKPAITPVLRPNSSRAGVNAVRGSTSTIRPPVITGQEIVYSTIAVFPTQDEVTTKAPRLPAGLTQRGYKEEESTPDRSSVKESVRKMSESPHRAKEYVTSRITTTTTTTTKENVRSTERKYYDRTSTAPWERKTTTQTEIKSTEVDITYGTTESYDPVKAWSQTSLHTSATVPDRVQKTLLADRASTPPVTAETTTQTATKSTEVQMTVRTTEKSAYSPYGENAGKNNTTERAGSATTQRASTTARLERVNVSVYLVGQETTTIYPTTEVMTEVKLVLETTAAQQAYSELTPTEMHPQEVQNTTDECTCPMCPSCFTVFAGYHLSKEDVAGIAAGMVILFLAVIVLLLKRCPAIARVTERLTPFRASGEEVEEPYRPSFHHPNQSHHFRGESGRDVDDTRDTRPEATTRLDKNGRLNNEYDQTESRQPPNSRLPYAQERTDLRVPPNRKRRVSVEIVDGPPILPDHVSDGNAPASSMESDIPIPLVQVSGGNDAVSFVENDIVSDEGIFMAALDGSPVQFGADDAARMDAVGENQLGFIAAPGDHRRSIELAAQSASGLVNPPNGQPSTSAGLNVNVGTGDNRRVGNAEHEEDKGAGQNHQHNEQPGVNGAPPPPVQAYPGRLAASFLDSARQALFGGKNSVNNGTPAHRHRKRNQSVPASADRAATRSVTRGIQNANAPLYENVSVDVVNEE